MTPPGIALLGLRTLSALKRQAGKSFLVAINDNFQYGFHEREVFPAHREIVVAVNELDSITGSSGTIAWELVRPVKILFSSKTTF